MSRPALQHRISTQTQSKIVVLVTAGNTGTGPQIVAQLAKDPQYQVLLGCTNTDRGEETVNTLGAPINVNPIQLDITKDQSIQQCFLAIDQHFGKLDVLIHNTETRVRDLEGEPTLRQMAQAVFDVNVVSAYVFTENMLPLLGSAKAPKIIFTSSSEASMQNALSKDSGPIGSPQYAASKTALHMLAIDLAKRLPAWKINVVDTSPRHGSDIDQGTSRIVQLATEGVDGPTGTFSNASGEVPW